MNPFAKGALFTAFGPFIAGLIMSRADKNVRNSYSFMGTSITGSVIFFLSFILTLMFVKIENNYSGFYMLAFSVYILLYSIGEEYGWRGYLQHALKKKHFFLKYLIIGTLWWFWHIGIYIDMGYKLIVLFWVLWVLISMGLGQAMEATKSIAVVACLHILGNVLFMIDVIPVPDKFIIAGILAVIWIITLFLWDKLDNFFS
jgi:uncharacterized protein